jgi:hypothetical protein
MRAEAVLRRYTLAVVRRATPSAGDLWCRVRNFRVRAKSKPATSAVPQGLLRRLALRSLHLSRRLLDTLLQVFKVHARSHRDIRLPEHKQGVTNHR